MPTNENTQFFISKFDVQNSLFDIFGNSPFRGPGGLKTVKPLMGRGLY
jgi:hypothetical protein